MELSLNLKSLGEALLTEAKIEAVSNALDHVEMKDVTFQGSMFFADPPTTAFKYLRILVDG